MQGGRTEETEIYVPKNNNYYSSYERARLLGTFRIEGRLWLTYKIDDVPLSYMYRLK